MGRVVCQSLYLGNEQERKIRGLGWFAGRICSVERKRSLGTYQRHPHPRRHHGGTCQPGDAVQKVNVSNAILMMSSSCQTIAKPMAGRTWRRSRRSGDGCQAHPQSWLWWPRLGQTPKGYSTGMVQLTGCWSEGLCSRAAGAVVGAGSARICSVEVILKFGICFCLGGVEEGCEGCEKGLGMV